LRNAIFKRLGRQIWIDITMKASIGIIGGTGLQSIAGINVLSEYETNNEFGAPSSKLSILNINGIDTIFLARHGKPHHIPPHKVNYRANIYALNEYGVKNIISVNAVGGITSNMSPGAIVLPDQIIDYTWSRQHTFYDDNPDTVVHVDFTNPYSNLLRNNVIKAAEQTGVDLIPVCTYGATQGPRLETAAEIKRLESDGCDVVGMTGMPEAALARELEIDYVSISLVVNWAAGKTDEIITMESIQTYIDTGMAKISTLIKEVVKNI
jgi:5'-methylthioinosine phosphorylase